MCNTRVDTSREKSRRFIYIKMFWENNSATCFEEKRLTILKSIEVKHLLTLQWIERIDRQGERTWEINDEGRNDQLKEINDQGQNKIGDKWPGGNDLRDKMSTGGYDLEVKHQLIDTWEGVRKWYRWNVTWGLGGGGGETTRFCTRTERPGAHLTLISAAVVTGTIGRLEWRPLHVLGKGKSPWFWHVHEWRKTSVYQTRQAQPLGQTRRNRKETPTPWRMSCNVVGNQYALQLLAFFKRKNWNWLTLSD